MICHKTDMNTFLFKIYEIREGIGVIQNSNCVTFLVTYPHLHNILLNYDKG